MQANILNDEQGCLHFNRFLKIKETTIIDKTTSQQFLSKQSIITSTNYLNSVTNYLDQTQ